jgi:hypothetical protein
MGLLPKEQKSKATDPRKLIPAGVSMFVPVSPKFWRKVRVQNACI